MKQPIYIFLGAAGSGKGTQSQKITKEYNVLQLSTGDLLREAVADQTALGKQAKSFMDNGDLVPDQLIVDLISQKLQDPELSNKPIILDGFPRSIGQAKALKSMLDNIKTRELHRVVLFEISLEETINRLTGRRLCPDCKQIYHKNFSPPQKEGICDACKAHLVQRSDDTEEKVRHRYTVYLDQTKPLIEFYDETLSVIQAVGSADDIYAQLVTVLDLHENKVCHQ